MNAPEERWDYQQQQLQEEREQRTIYALMLCMDAGAPQGAVSFLAERLGLDFDDRRDA